MGLKTLFSLFFITVFHATSLWSQSSDKLWYDEPANYFEETLVLGNGQQGATVFGGTATETIYLNDITLWSGSPVKVADMNPEAYKYLPAVREALKNEDYALADSLNKSLQGKNSETYAPLGTLKINFHNEGEVKNYYRELDLNNAISSVAYEQNGVEYKREYFVSHPDKVLIIKLTSNNKKALNFDIKFESLLNYKTAVNKGVLKGVGSAQIHSSPTYLSDTVFEARAKENGGTRFISLIQLKNTDGELISTDSTIGVQNASEVLVYVSLATSFNGFDKNPVTEGADYEGIANKQLEKAFAKTYQELKTNHVSDYQTYFKRVSLSLGETTAPNLPTDERLKRYAEGKEDKNLEILYFQYGRYLLISSSRTPEVPANLQGLWNHHYYPPWSSNYTMNINIEENYWLAENANLSEMHQPLLSFINNLATTGAVTAKTFYGAGGWCVAHNSDIWAMSNPVGNFGQGYPGWANWNMGGVWVSTHLWEHYTFTKDEVFLKNKAYPLMKGAVQFCLDWMVEDKDGKLITSPSTSPENNYITDKGYHGATFYGGSADIAMIRELFTQTLAAETVLENDEAFSLKLKQALDKLLPYKISETGSLQEWYFDWKDEDPQHRHQSHLFGLFPGHQITPVATPSLANACRKTLEIKGDETTGWSKGWRINLWARLGDGNHAYKMYRELLNYVEPDAIRPKDSWRGGTYPNLFDAHPPFQIDGNFGGAAAVVEMLLQSTENEIYLLPALPDNWNTGEVQGICARGGFVIDMKWKNGKLKTVKVTSKAGSPCKINYGGKTMDVVLKSGETKELTF
ncbi:MAG: glycoside hydrolase family 95 protein [Salinivirgaceae bacterium]|jgi:alpha-L-fucosidase 2|nr:glycoside hydrolase family 95 protein [Salinivirgaceae bacterium]